MISGCRISPPMLAAGATTDGAGGPSRGAAVPPELPQRQPGDEAGAHHQDERQERSVVMRRHGCVRDLRSPHEGLLRRHARQVHGQRGQRDQEEDLEAGMLQVLVAPEHRQQEQTDGHHGAHGRHMIHEQVQVREVQIEWHGPLPCLN
jgi:hypothetical protein